MKKFVQIKNYLFWRLKAKSIFNVHSPFAYELLEFLRKKPVSHHCRRYDKYVSRLKRSKTVIDTVDFGTGAGNSEYKTKKMEVGKIVQQRSHKTKQLHILYRLSNYLRPNTILEFGTAVGVSAVYIKKSIPNSRMVTMEGCTALADRAKRTFKDLHVHNVEISIGNFDVILPDVLKSFDKLDMIFFDGNHREKPTLKYFDKCISLAHEDSVFIFDDIHWSTGMEKAWKTIQNDNRVTLTIDLYWFGLIFFKKGIVKQNMSVII